MANSSFNGLRDNDAAAHPDFDRIINDYLDELNANGFVDPNQILEDHPELGPAILKDLETYIELNGPGEDSSTEDEGDDDAEQDDGVAIHGSAPHRIEDAQHKPSTILQESRSQNWVDFGRCC